MTHPTSCKGAAPHSLNASLCKDVSFQASQRLVCRTGRLDGPIEGSHGEPSSSKSSTKTFLSAKQTVRQICRVHTNRYLALLCRESRLSPESSCRTRAARPRFEFPVRSCPQPASPDREQPLPRHHRLALSLDNGDALVAAPRAARPRRDANPSAPRYLETNLVRVGLYVTRIPDSWECLTKPHVS